MQSAGRLFVRLCGVAIIAGGLAAALALIFVPLRVIAVSSSLVGYCGPGLSSASAIQVRLDPGIVNTGGSAASLAQQRQLERLCTNEADGRLTEAAIIAAVALGLGLPLIAVGSRHPTRSASSSSSGPSLSSSGTSGSTVWK